MEFKEDLLAKLLNKEAIVFCGAGISLEPPAGLPSWKKLRDFTLQAIASKHWTAHECLSSLLTTPMIAEPGEKGLTPEVVASEIAANCEGYFDSFRALNDGSPNVNHTYLAKLARKGFLSCIITTNFDLFIEKALGQEGVNYRVYRTEKEFECYQQGSHVALLKLHGCISLPETITSTVEQEARGLSIVKQQLLTSLLRSYYVIFWGYSGADLKINLDYLQMVSQKEHARGFYWHFFQNDTYTEPINANVKKLADLYGSKSQIMHGKLPYIFESLLTDHPIKADNYNDDERKEWQQKKDENLQTALFNWADNKVTIPYALTIIGNLLYFNGELNSAANCYLDCITVCQKQENYSSEAAMWSNVGGIYRIMGFYEEALECYAEAEKIAIEQQDKENLAIFINNIGKVYRTQGNYLKAASYYKNAASLNRALENYRELAIALNNIGMAYTFLGEYTQALEHYYEALSMSKYLGDKQSIGAQRSNLGNVYHTLGNHDQALAQYLEVERICCALGDKNNLTICLNNIGTIYKENGYNTKAIEYFEQALSLAEKIGDVHNCAVVNKNLGILYEKFNFTKATNYYSKSQHYYYNLNEIKQVENIKHLLQNLEFVEKDIENTTNKINIPPLEDGIESELVKQLKKEKEKKLEMERKEMQLYRLRASMMCNIAPRELKPQTEEKPPLHKNSKGIMATQISPLELKRKH